MNQLQLGLNSTSSALKKAHCGGGDGSAGRIRKASLTLIKAWLSEQRGWRLAAGEEILKVRPWAQIEVLDHVPLSNWWNHPAVGMVKSRLFLVCECDQQMKGPSPASPQALWDIPSTKTTTQKGLGYVQIWQVFWILWFVPVQFSKFKVWVSDSEFGIINTTKE